MGKEASRCRGIYGRNGGGEGYEEIVAGVSSGGIIGNPYSAVSGRGSPFVYGFEGD